MLFNWTATVRHFVDLRSTKEGGKASGKPRPTRGGFRVLPPGLAAPHPCVACPGALRIGGSMLANNGKQVNESESNTELYIIVYHNYSIL